MAKNKISEFSTNPANNTDIGGIDIAEGCAPSGINNAIRELMAQLKDQQAGTDGDNLTVGGNLSITGTTTATTGSFSGVATFSAGSAGAPAITTSGDTNTGVFFPASDTIAFVEGGVEAMRITSLGEVGIGTTTPGVKLDVSTSSNASIRATSTDVTGAAVGSLIAKYTGGGGGVASEFAMQTGDGYSKLTTITNTLLQLGTNQIERMRIHTSGGVSIGNTTDPGATNLSVTGTIAGSNITASGNVTGNAATASNAIGFNQTWQDVSGSRASGTNYTNSTGRPIFISVRWDRDDGTLELMVDSLLIGKTGNTSGPQFYTLTAIIPAGSIYRATATGSGGTLSWYELR